jgi:hypothetical protein
MKYIKTYEKLTFDILNSLFNTAFNKAIKHFTKLHEKITEEHVFEFINHLMINNYGLDITHSKETYKHFKYLIHKKLKK